MDSYQSHKKIDWYSNECFICLEEFCESNPRIFAYQCIHCICGKCLTVLKNNTECTVCNSVVNPIMYNIKKFKIYKLDEGNTSYVCIGDSITELPRDEDMLQHLLMNIHKKEKKRSYSCCCIL